MITIVEGEEQLKRIQNLKKWIEAVKAYQPPKKKRENNRNFLKRFPQCDDDLTWALYECYQMARRGKRRTRDEQKFEIFFEKNLAQLKEDIISRRWKPSRSKTFVSHEPVDREIFAAQFRDRIVHHLLYAVVAPWWDKRFIFDSYSCRVGRGTDMGVKRMQKFMRKASRNGKHPAYVLKGDFSGYFMSLKRQTLYNKVIKGLKKQFPERGWLYELCKYLWHEVIFDDPCRGMRMVGSLKDWDVLPPNKTLIYQPKGQGIVIGNLTSQLLSNIMLNEFDWYVKKILKNCYYGRYVDDFFIVVPVEYFEWAKQVFYYILPKKARGMGLTIHPKKIYIQEVKKGCPYLGKMVRPFSITPGKRYLRKMRKAFYDYADGYVDEEVVKSYIGLGKHMNVYNTLKNTIIKIEKQCKDI